MKRLGQHAGEELCVQLDSDDAVHAEPAEHLDSNRRPRILSASRTVESDLMWNLKAVAVGFQHGGPGLRGFGLRGAEAKDPELRGARFEGLDYPPGELD